MNEFNENAIIERVKEVRNRFSGPRGKSNFAHALGISPSTYDYYEKNRVPPIDILLKISKLTATDLNWLITGSEDIQKQSAQPFGPLQNQSSEIMLKIQQLLSNAPQSAEAISVFIDFLIEKRGLENKLGSFNQKTLLPRFESEDAGESKGCGWIPILGRTAAGTVHFWDQQILPQSQQVVTELEHLVKRHIGKEIIGFTDGKATIDLQTRPLVEGLKKGKVNVIQVSSPDSEQFAEFVQCEQIYSLFKDSFALRVDGDSMSPRINDGDIVLLSPSAPAAQGQISIIKINNQIGVTCKLLRIGGDNVHLVPINEKYETKIIPKRDIAWALAVLCHITF